MDRPPQFPASIVIDPNLETPLFWQLYEGLCQAILAGQFSPGAKLPPTRALADHLKVSRTTVHLAYGRLIDEGYLEGRQGSGTRVTQALPDQLPYGDKKVSVEPARAQGKRPIAQRASQLLQCFGLDYQGKVGLSNVFMPGGAAFDQFPHKVWQRLLVRSWQSLAHGALASTGTDYRPLCEAIASHLGTTRGVRCSADQVIMVAGSQQGLDLALRVLLDPGEEAWIEDPCYRGAHGAMLGAGIKPVAIPVDGEGLEVGTGRRDCQQARLAYVTPSYQYPLGMTMSLGRRLQLLDWASGEQAWVLEDDYHSDFRYTGRPLAALQGLDQERRVVYLGTFSKVLFPSLRLAYLIVPPDLVEAFLAMRHFSSRCPPLLNQATLADFINEGHFARHIRRMCRLYAKRQSAFIEVARTELDGLLRFEPAEAGMHLLGWLDEDMDDWEASRKAALGGFNITPLGAHSLVSKQANGLVLGYTAIDEQRLRKAIRALGRALK